MRSALFLLALFFAGCQTPHNFAAPDAEWQSRVGQLRYLSSGRSLTGDVVVRWHNDRKFQLEFSSGPGFPLLRLSQEGEIARAEGILARGGWQGRTENAPRELQDWLYLRERFAAMTRDQRRMEIVSQSGSRFSFYFGS